MEYAGGAYIVGIDRSELRGKIFALLVGYETALENGEPESVIDEHIFRIEELSPNSDFSDMMFYGELDRTNQELAAEAAWREDVFDQYGRLGVLEHIRLQMCEALANPDIAGVHRQHAEMKIAEIDTNTPTGNA